MVRGYAGLRVLCLVGPDDPHVCMLGGGGFLWLLVIRSLLSWDSDGSRDLRRGMNRKGDRA
jgi:hypothetical protein